MSRLSDTIQRCPKGATLVVTKASKAMTHELCIMMGREDLKLEVADEGGFGGQALSGITVDEAKEMRTLVNVGDRQKPVWVPLGHTASREACKAAGNPFHQVVFCPLPTEKTEEP